MIPVGWIALMAGAFVLFVAVLPALLRWLDEWLDGVDDCY